MPGASRFAAIVVALALAAMGLVGCSAEVTPHAPVSIWEFEGFEVVSSIPEHPVGLVYVFHGTNGSARIANRVETVDTLNELTDRGYGFVSTESTERTGDQRWEVFDPSLTTNPDLARLARLQSLLVGTTGVDADTPLVGIGMSNGARFVSLWGRTWADGGYPVAAIAMYMGRLAPPVAAGGGLRGLPTFFVAAANDFTVPPSGVVADHDTTAASGTPTELVVAQEQPLTSDRFLRIPGIDADEARATFDAFVATGAWDGAGRRLVPIDQAVTLALGARLPDTVAPVASHVADQVALVLAVHQMRGDVKVPVADFFAAHL